MKRLTILATLMVVALGTMGCGNSRFRLWDNWGDACNACDPCGDSYGYDESYGASGTYLPAGGYLPGPGEIITPAP